MLKKSLFASLLALLAIASSAQAGIIVNGAPLSNIDNSFTVGSVVAVGNLGTITDINVSYAINNNGGNGFWTDIQVLLTSPSATTVTLFPGGVSLLATPTPGTLNVTLDDSAINSLPIGGGTFTGSFNPFSALSAFNGESTLGNWTISFIDPSFSGDGDDLVSWSLDFTTAAAVPEPASMAIWGGLALAGAVAGYRRRKTA
jgi:subtilisin-like proprotein convertase family protein